MLADLVGVGCAGAPGVGDAQRVVERRVGVLGHALSSGAAQPIVCDAQQVGLLCQAAHLVSVLVIGSLGGAGAQAQQLAGTVMHVVGEEVPHNQLDEVDQPTAGGKGHRLFS
jgi:hypothetical protein